MAMSFGGWVLAHSFEQSFIWIWFGSIFSSTILTSFGEHHSIFKLVNKLCQRNCKYCIAVNTTFLPYNKHTFHLLSHILPQRCNPVVGVQRLPFTFNRKVSSIFCGVGVRLCRSPLTAKGTKPYRLFRCRCSAVAVHS